MDVVTLLKPLESSAGLDHEDQEGEINTDIIMSKFDFRGGYVRIVLLTSTCRHAGFLHALPQREVPQDRTGALCLGDRSPAAVLHTLFFLILRHARSCLFCLGAAWQG